MTEKGKELSIQEETKLSGGTKLTYNEVAQQFIKDNYEMILKEAVNGDYEDPGLSPIEFKNWD